MLGPLPLKVRTLKEFPAAPEVEEDGATLEENAKKKALVTARHAGLWTLSDDTGLFVLPLGGAPGVHSARYAGEDCDFAKNNRKLLQELAALPLEERKASFRCVVALAHPDGRVVLREGSVDGLITDVYHGDEGFGYDPVFFVPDLGKTLGELPFEQKCRVSHRARAIAAIKPDILKALEVPDARSAKTS